MRYLTLRLIPIGGFLFILFALAMSMMARRGDLPAIHIASADVAISAEQNMLQINADNMLHTPLPHIGTGLSDALERHAEWEVSFVRRCFDERGGALRIWRESYIKDNGRKTFRFHLICLAMDNMTWVDRIVEKIDGAWEEVTAFIPKDGTLEGLTRWLGQKVGELWCKPLP